MITELTKEQETMIPEYVRIGIDIGLATGSDLDEQKVRELTDAHRELCGVKKAKNFVVYDSPFQAVRKVEGLTYYNALYGQHDIYWLIYYQYLRVECGLTGLDDIQYLLELSKRVGWMWMGNHTTVVTRRPDHIHLRSKKDVNGNEIQVLHNPNSKALKYRDGTGVYCLNGVRIVDQIAIDIIDSDKNDLAYTDIMKIKNTENRNEIIKMVGIEKLFDHLNKKELDSKTLKSGGLYTLLAIEVGDKDRVYLQGECPSNQENFIEAVPPECKTVDQALSFRNFGSIDVPFQSPERLT